MNSRRPPGNWPAPCSQGMPSATPTKTSRSSKSRKTFTGEIRNPDTGRPSQTFVMAGKADAIVQRPRRDVPAGAQDRLQHRRQLPRQAVDRHADRALQPLPAATRLSDRRRDLQRVAQVPAEAEQRARRSGEFEARRAELAAKNKSGRSTAKRQMPETDESSRPAWPNGTPADPRRSTASTFTCPKTAWRCCRKRSGRSPSNTSMPGAAASGC